MYIFRELDGERVLYKPAKRVGNGQKYIFFTCRFVFVARLLSPVPAFIFLFKEAFSGDAPFALRNPDRNDRRRQTTFILRAI